MIEEDTIYNLYYEQDLSLKDIANKLNISVWKLCEIMNKYGMKRRKFCGRRLYRTFTKGDIKTAYDNSDNLLEASNKLKISKKCFRGLMKDYDIKIRTKKETQQLKNKIKGEQIKRLYENGMSVRDIAKKFNTTWYKIYRIMELFDIPRKDLNQKGKKRPYQNYKGHHNINWKGGIMYDGKRKLVYLPNHPNPNFSNNYVYNYRLVMEKYLGRYLKKEEIIHHINGDESDDRIENLELLDNQSIHCKKHFGEKNVN